MKVEAPNNNVKVVVLTTSLFFILQAITIAWIGVGYMFQTMGVGRSDEGRSNSQEPWEQLVPDSGTVATILYDLSEAAQRWHDEL